MNLDKFFFFNSLIQKTVNKNKIKKIHLKFQVSFYLNKTT